MDQPQNERKNPIGENTNLRVNHNLQTETSRNIVRWMDCDFRQWFGVIIANHSSPCDDHAKGGWFVDDNGTRRFRMPPYPGVDDICPDCGGYLPAGAK